MWAAILKKSWFRAARLYDAWFAFAEGGWRGVRQLLRDAVSFRLTAKKSGKLKPRWVSPTFEMLETREMMATTIAGSLRTADPRAVTLIPFNHAAVDLNLGAVRIDQALDFDLSPGTAMGGDPALLYNSAIVGVRPLIQVAVTPDVGLGTPSQVRLRLTWDGGSPQSWVSYFPSTTDPAVLGVQQDTALTATGRFDWLVDVEVYYSGSTFTGSVNGRASAVVGDSSVSGQIDPYGAGWGIAGVDRLVTATDGIVYVYGTGESRFFSGSGPYTSPAGEFGTLVATSTGFTYTANGIIEERFDSSGLMTWAKDTGNFTRSYAYDSGSRLTKVTAGDGSTATIAYDSTNHLLQTITEPGSRTLGASQAVSSGVGKLTQLVDAVGYTRAIAYDGTYHLTSDSWAPYSTSLAYDASTGAINSLDLGSGTTYGIVPAMSRSLFGMGGATPTESSQGMVKDAATLTALYDFDLQGRVLREVNQAAETLTWQRDGNGLVTASLDRNGNTTSFGYDAYGLLTSQRIPSGTSLAYTRDTSTGGVFYDRVTLSVVNGATSTFSYSSGQLTRSVDPDGYTVNYAWSGNRMIQRSDALTGTTGYAFDSYARQTQIIDALGGTTGIVFDGFGNVASTIDANGGTSTTTFDANNRLTAQTDAGGNTIATCGYTAAGLVTSATSYGVASSLLYNSRGLVTQSMDGANNTTTYAYNSLANRTAIVDPLGNTLLQSFDAAGRITQSVDFTGVTRRSSLDRNGNVTQLLTFDAAATYSVAYSYNPNDVLTRTVDSGGRTSIQSFDTYGRSIGSTDANGISTSCPLAPDGMPTATIDGMGQTTLLYYDLANRLTQTVDPAGNTNCMLYDSLNRVTATVDPNGRTFLASFDRIGNVTQTVDPAGNTNCMLYDPANHLTSTVDPNSRTFTREYDSGGRVTQTIDANNRTNITTYDGNGRVAVSINGAGDTSAQYYDGNGMVTSVVDGTGAATLQVFSVNTGPMSSVFFQRTDPNGHAAIWDYVAGRVNSVTTGGNTQALSLDDSGLTTRIVDSGNVTVLQNFDGCGLPTQTVNALGYTSLIAYDALNRVTMTTDGSGASTCLLYDPAGRVTQTVDGTGATSHSAYDRAGNLTQSIDRNGFTTLNYYDALNRLTMSVDPGNHTFQQSFDLCGLPTMTIDGNGRTVLRSYDPGNLLTRVVDGNGFTSLYQYDGANRLTQTIDGDNRTSTLAYDGAGHVTLQVDGNGHSRQMAYDPGGQLTQTIDGGGFTTLLRYDAYGNHTGTIDSLGFTTLLSYDYANRVTMVRDGLGNQTSYSLDKEGQVTYVAAPNMAMSYRNYDGVGRLTQMITPNHATFHYTYDGVGRLMSNANGAFTYDGEGRLLTASNANGTYSMLYDRSGQVTQVTEPYGLTLNYAYDSAGNQTQVTDSFGGTQVSIYDADHFLTRRTYQGQTLTLRTDFAHNREGWITTMSRYSDSGGLTLVAKTDYGYDSVGRITSVHSKDAGNATINQFLYAIDAADRLTQVIETQNSATLTTTYGYDSESQLTADGTTAYTYDGSGNRTGGSYGASGNRMTADAGWNYYYDDNGNLNKKIEVGSGITWKYAWSDNNNLLEAKKWSSDPDVPGTAVLQLEADYKYDAFGNRIEKSVDSDGAGAGAAVIARFGFDGFNPAKPNPVGLENFEIWAQLDDQNALTTRYVHGDMVDQLIGRIEVGSPNTTYWTLTDQLGSIRDVIDNSGVPQDSIKYDAFGTLTETVPGLVGFFGWTGREFDEETGLQRNGQRYFAPGMGRFISEDPLSFGGGDANLYRYVGNNATNAMDPSGLEGVGDYLWAGGRTVLTLGFAPVAVPVRVLFLDGFDGVIQDADTLTFGVTTSVIRSSDGLLGHVTTGWYATQAVPRSVGVGQAGAGLLEMVAGGATSWIPGLGILTFLHGLDNFVAGVLTASTGEYTPTITERLITPALVQNGVAPQDAPTYAANINVAITILATLGCQLTAPRPLPVIEQPQVGGRVSLPVIEQPQVGNGRVSLPVIEQPQMPPPVPPTPPPPTIPTTPVAPTPPAPGWTPAPGGGWQPPPPTASFEMPPGALNQPILGTTPRPSLWPEWSRPPFFKGPGTDGASLGGPFKFPPPPPSVN